MAVKTRSERIAAGKLWQVYPDGEPHNVLCEGTRTHCWQYIVRQGGGSSAYKKGKIRLAKVIGEIGRLDATVEIEEPESEK